MLKVLLGEIPPADAPVFYDINTDNIRYVTQADVDKWLTTLKAGWLYHQAIIDARHQYREALGLNVTAKEQVLDAFESVKL